MKELNRRRSQQRDHLGERPELKFNEAEEEVHWSRRRQAAVSGGTGGKLYHEGGEEKNEEQTEKKSEAEEEEREVKRSIEKWEEFAKKLKTKAKQRAEESKNPEKEWTLLTWP